METTVDVNHIFPERITVLDQNLIAFTKSLGRSDPQSLIAAVIDELGRASAKAQYLTAPITSASKLQTNKHHLYLLKDRESNGGKGLAVGFLKVGCKKLFLLDQRGAHVETEPLCVLDFFVTDHFQRHGYGLELFSFMLQHKKVEPVMMAYDRPSPKFLSFLEKHYCLKNGVPQVNNFVVFDGFFTNRSGSPPSPLPDQRRYGFFGPVEKGSPHKAGRRDQALLTNTERSCGRGTEGSLLAFVLPRGSSLLSSVVGILPVLPKQGPPVPQPGPGPSICPWGLQGPGPQPPTHRQPQLQGKTHQPTGPSCQGKPLQSLHQHPGLWAVVGDPAEHLQTARSLPPLSLSRKELLCSQTTREPDRQAGMETRVLENRLRVGVGGEPWPGRAGEKGGGPQVVEKGTLGAEKDRGRGGWSWTVGESCCNTAQWVRQKQEYNNTRPW
nr:alpha-tubulin N-acetyltransferase 1-like isoform X2 [Oncorhynchus nerka]